MIRIFTLIILSIIISAASLTAAEPTFCEDEEEGKEKIAFLPFLKDRPFYFGIGFKIPSSGGGSLDISTLPLSIRKILSKVNHAENFLTHQPLYSKDFLFPSELNYIFGLNTSFVLGYKTENIGRFELEAAFNRVFGDNTKHLVNHDSSIILLNWYTDFIDTKVCTIFLGGGLGYTWNFVSIGVGEVESELIRSWTAKGKTGVKWKITESVDLVTAYELFLPKKESFIWDKETVDDINIIEGRLQNLYDKFDVWPHVITQLLGKRDAITPLAPISPNAGLYFPHGPTIELHIKL